MEKLAAGKEGRWEFSKPFQNSLLLRKKILAECAINCWHHDSKCLLNSLPSFLPSFLDAAPWLFSLLCHFARLFLDPLLTNACHAVVTKAMGLFLLFSDTLVCYSSWRSPVLHLFLPGRDYPSVVESLTHSMLLDVLEPPVGPAWGPSCHQPPPTAVCVAVGEARGAECTMC